MILLFLTLNIPASSSPEEDCLQLVQDLSDVHHITPPGFSSAPAIVLWYHLLCQSRASSLLRHGSHGLGLRLSPTSSSLLPLVSYSAVHVPCRNLDKLPRDWKRKQLERR